MFHLPPLSVISVLYRHLPLEDIWISYATSKSHAVVIITKAAVPAKLGCFCKKVMQNLSLSQSNNHFVYLMFVICHCMVLEIPFCLCKMYKDIPRENMSVRNVSEQCYYCDKKRSTGGIKEFLDEGEPELSIVGCAFTVSLLTSSLLGRTLCGCGRREIKRLR